MELEEAIEKINEIRKEYGRFDGLTEYVEAIDFVINHLIKQDKMIDELTQNEEKLKIELGKEKEKNKELERKLMIIENKTLGQQTYNEYCE